jgi:hypothetical protein
MCQSTPCQSTPRRVLLSLALAAALLTALVPAAPASALPPPDAGHHATVAPAPGPGAGAVSVAGLWHRLVSRAAAWAAATLTAVAPQQEPTDLLLVAKAEPGSSENGPSLDPNGLK